MILHSLYKNNLISPPDFVLNNSSYLCLMGSVSYGVSNVESDVDIYGFCIPPKTDVFPHLKGEILGFGKQTKRFEQWQKHHIYDPSRKKEYDFSIYSIVKYFKLCLDNNPNMIDSLFVPERCVVHIDVIGKLVRDNKHLFLHRGCYHKFKGYAYSQLHKIRIKKPEKDSNRYELCKKYGYDVKYAYHLVRLLNECEQLLLYGDLDLQINREQLKSIRRGEWSIDQIEDYFKRKELLLEDLFTKTKLPVTPREEEVKHLLFKCLEESYGNLSNFTNLNSDCINDVKKVLKILEKYK